MYLTIFIAIFFIAVAYLTSFNYAIGDTIFLCIPLITGLLITIFQREDKTKKFILKLAVGSVIFSFFSVFLIMSYRYLTIANETYPLETFLNINDYFLFSFTLFTVSIIGGLIGILLKGVKNLTSDY